MSRIYILITFQIEHKNTMYGTVCFFLHLEPHHEGFIDSSKIRGCFVDKD